ncbi:FAD-dependent oxidoreductase [Pseudoblastomonas halimionae]|uniref:FAD-dependent monooxygenase n=1 Tax=Alteriqipengyuania halimionae TaxID=1926630 RepID=A0A6I4U2J2_9SPHN|nr:NAD(P)/FAD-dependent oxidoreductase [Alteriqipengyuania halimionae]MXP08692.1 FAD-dependent monooxygenase [Alteriqipengyuania halimionae]
MATASRLGTLSIAIAGCGPAGLAAALLFQRAGHAVTLFERFDAPRPVGSGLMLQPTGMAVLDAMGLLPQIARHGARIDGLLGHEEHGRTALDSPYRQLSSTAFGIGIHRASLFGELYDAVCEAGIAIRTSHEIAASQIRADKRLLCFADGSTSEGFDLLVDATGWNSALGNRHDGLLDFGALWATLPLDSDDPFAGNLLEQRYRRAAHMAGVLPTGRRDPEGPREVSFFWSLRGDRYDEWRATGLDAWKAEVQTLWPDLEGLLQRIESVDALTFARYAHRTTPRPHGERLIRIGDAWHCASPQLGQGANMALLDAWGLARGLAEGRSVAEGLRLTVAWRSDHVRLYQAVTRFFTPLYQSDAALPSILRDRVLMPLSRIWPGNHLQARIMSGLLGWPLASLGLREPDYRALARAIPA